MIFALLAKLLAADPEGSIQNSSRALRDDKKKKKKTVLLKFECTFVQALVWGQQHHCLLQVSEPMYVCNCQLFQ